MEFLLIVFLTLLNGVFAMSELALTASRKARLLAMAEADDAGAVAALTLLQNPTRFLSTVQVGITSIGVLNGIVGEAAFSGTVAAWLQGWGLSDKASGISATAIVVTLITFTTIIFGELVPKRIGQLYPEPVARLVARPMVWLAHAASPFVRLLSATTQGILKLLRIDNNAAQVVTEEEIAHSLDEGLDAGVIEEHEHQMVQNVFDLDERPLTSLMVPRADLQWLDAASSVAQALAFARTQAAVRAHSWYPVCRGGLDDVVGIISLGKLLQLGFEAPGSIADHLDPASFVPETLSGMELLEQFRKRAGRVVFVVDEYGVVQGLVTPADLLEAITGELKPRKQHDAWATRQEDGSWLLDGLVPITELKARLGLDTLPGEDRGRYNTLAGLLMAVTGHLPTVGEQIAASGWVFEVIALEGRRADKVRGRIKSAP